MPDPTPFLVRWRDYVLTVKARPSSRVRTPVVRHVALTLATHMDGRGGSCFPGGPLLADETGYEPATVSRAVAELVASGCLSSKRTGRSNRYQALLPAAVDKAVDPGDNGVEMPLVDGASTKSDMASDQIRVGPLPNEDVQGGRSSRREVQEHLLLGVDNSQGRQTVRAAIDGALGAEAA